MELAKVNTQLQVMFAMSPPSPVTSGLIRVTKNSPAETVPQSWPSFITKIKNLESKLRSSVSTH